MNILAIDPGATTGWTIYDSTKRRVIDSGEFDGCDVPAETPHSWYSVHMVLIERPKGYGPTRPQVVDCAYVAGRLYGRFDGKFPQGIHEMYRKDVCKALTDAVHEIIRVRNDATAWAAVKELHGGEGSDSKGRLGTKKLPALMCGPLGGVKSHGRAATALAVAWLHLQAQDAKAAAIVATANF